LERRPKISTSSSNCQFQYYFGKKKSSKTD
jgi:hypothetical protein